MKAGSMEGLIGASQNIKMLNVPMKVYREAEKKGELGTMERAMGYASDFSQKVEEYSEKAQKELIKEQKEERKEFEKLNKEKLEQNKAEEKAKEKTENSTGVKADISEEGKELAKENIQVETATLDNLDVPISYNEHGVSIPEVAASEISVTV